VLVDNGMQVFESTAMKRLEDHTIYTHGGSITADHIIIAVDKLEPHISPLSAEVFHAQTFLSVTEPLTDQERSILFPSGEQMQCWDSKLVYTYFRLTADNRLLLGGGSAITTSQGRVQQSRRHQARHRGLLRATSRSCRAWRSSSSGRADRHHPRPAADHRQAEGPAAPALHLRLRGNSLGDVHRQLRGAQCARGADDDYRKYFNYFSNERYFWLPSSLGNVIGKPMLFSLSNSWAKFRQVDKLRETADGQKEF
jgi:gamma-glutamylputrescine oxidase